MNRADREITDEQLIEWFGKPIVYQKDVAYYHDENISKSVTSLLRSEGVRATSIYEHGQLGEVSDIRILAKAHALGCILVTLDQDFEEIDERIKHLDDLHHPGVLLVTSKVLKQDIDQLVYALHRLAQKYEGFPNWLTNQVYTI